MTVPKLQARDDFYNSGNWSGGARWAFFAIFIVLIIIVILGTLRINRARSRQGIQPIYGTRWMTPPSYYQSQDQYNQPTRREPDMPNVYVPTYTEHAGEYDMGYYDNQGVFHPNPNAKDPTIPPPSHTRTGSGMDGVPISNSLRGSIEDEPSQQARGRLDGEGTDVNNRDATHETEPSNSRTQEGQVRANVAHTQH